MGKKALKVISIVVIMVVSVLMALASSGCARHNIIHKYKRDGCIDKTNGIGLLKK